jgi:hypothetical protein
MTHSTSSNHNLFTPPILTHRVLPTPPPHHHSVPATGFAARAPLLLLRAAMDTILRTRITLSRNLKRRVLRAATAPTCTCWRTTRRCKSSVVNLRKGQPSLGESSRLGVQAQGACPKSTRPGHTELREAL